MDRLACANLPAFPLQLLLKRHPEWASYPVAVVAEDKPQGLILWVNEKARRAGVLPGFRYAAAFSLANGLRAGETPAAEIEKATASLTNRLLRLTPEVEPAADEPGVFWLNGRGLNLLYASLKQWARAIHADIEAQSFRAVVVVGFTRFGTYATARTEKRTRIFGDPAEERRAVKKVPLDRLDLEPGFRDALLKLGVRTVGALLSLPPGGLYERFGPKAYRLHRMARGDLWTPLDPRKPEEPVGRKHLLDEPEADATRLLFLIKRLLDPTLASLAARSQALAALRLSLLVERSGRLQERIRPAVPTLDSAQLLDLVRLRLESMRFSAGITEIDLGAEGCAATREQLRLFAERPGRDLDVADRALARLRAEFGDEAVVRAKLADGHLPEARFIWEPLRRIELPQPPVHSTHTSSQPADNLEISSFNGLNDLNGLNRLNGPKECSFRTTLGDESRAGARRETADAEADRSCQAPAAEISSHGVGGEPSRQRSIGCGRKPCLCAEFPEESSGVLVRRILAKPMPLPYGPHRTTHEDGWLILGPKYGSVEKLSGPYVFSGGWWNREIQRDYYFAETRRGDILWIYYDRVRRRWFLQGAVE